MRNQFISDVFRVLTVLLGILLLISVYVVTQIMLTESYVWRDYSPQVLKIIAIGIVSGHAVLMWMHVKKKADDEYVLHLLLRAVYVLHYLVIAIYAFELLYADLEPILAFVIAGGIWALAVVLTEVMHRKLRLMW